MTKWHGLFGSYCGQRFICWQFTVENENETHNLQKQNPITK
jgi:hypothetical protein